MHEKFKGSYKNIREIMKPVEVSFGRISARFSSRCSRVGAAMFRAK
jgi:hypothetical protein